MDTKDKYVDAIMAGIYKLYIELGTDRVPLDGDEVDDVVEEVRRCLNELEGNE